MSADKTKETCMYCMIRLNIARISRKANNLPENNKSDLRFDISFSLTEDIITTITIDD